MGAIPFPSAVQKALDNLPAVKFKLADGVILPQRSSGGAACYDLVATGVTHNPDGTAICSTGLQVELPKGWAMLIYSRSGMGFNATTCLVNSVGVIDEDYRGEILVKLVNHRPGYLPQVKDGDSLRNVQAGDKVAQFMIVPVFNLPFEPVEELTDTDRGVNGFGSTGA